MTASTGLAQRVPFLDLSPSHAPLKEALLGEFGELIDGGAFTNGPAVHEFETAFAGYCGTSHCVGVGSGLDALRLALEAAGLQPGEKVIVPANTFIATFEAVSQAGGVPVPVDVSHDDYNLDPAAVEAAVDSATRFVLPVHLYGQMADMHRIHAIARRHDLLVVEDGCQAHGAVRDGLRAGSVGDAAAFSFYPGKNLGAMGDAGALTTDDETLADRVRSLREHGQRQKYHHESIGYTARLDTIQAVVLLAKLPSLDGWNDERRTIADFYNDQLTDVGDLELPPVAAGSEPVWHLYVVATAAPAELGAFLQEGGIGTGRHYPQPAHLSQAYASLGYRAGDFPVTEQLCGRLLSLPIFPGMTLEQQERVVDAVRAYFSRG
jgi:dTDP-4-amino-4,6-dideoxygalactose transaminase